MLCRTGPLTDSPDLNPQENVWPWVENRVRKDAKLTTFDKFKAGLLKIAKGYPAEGLVASVAERVRECIALKGGATSH